MRGMTRAGAALVAVRQSWVVADLITEIATLPIGTSGSKLLEKLERESAELERLDEVWKSMPPRIVPRRTLRGVRK
jgi:hypothetical protein